MDNKRLQITKHPIAYFCAEFGVSDNLPIYSGGLGVLAGDVVKEANDRGLPFVAVGLFYHHGFFKQIINEQGEQIETPIIIDPYTVLQEVKTKKDKPLIIKIPFMKGHLYVKVWKYMVGEVPLYLLDTNIEQNTKSNRNITQSLYSGDKEMRIKQEIVLGIGGERALYEMDIHPSIYHLNEGHSAFSIYEITHHVMREHKITFKEAFNKVHQTIVFTNHTLVAAGNDVFKKETIAKYLSSYAGHLGLSMKEMFDKGTVPGKPKHLGMSILALNMSCRTNAVSQMHSRFAKKMWPKHKLTGITNGVHLPTWISQDIQKAVHSFVPSAIDSLNDKYLWQLHKRNKKRMVDFVYEHTGTSLDTKVCTLVWARRFATYKRPDILFSEISALEKLSKSAHGAFQLIVAGKAHPKDIEGKKIIAHINESIRKHGLQSWIVFVPNYSLDVAKYLVQGADVWLNTPIKGKEASGTSGMKAGANGVLQCSTVDGWVDEVPLDQIGWELSDKYTSRDLYKTLENEILPLYYTQQGGYSSGWAGKMKKTMKVVWKQFSSRRMVSEYIEKLYVPAWKLVEKNHHDLNNLPDQSEHYY